MAVETGLVRYQMYIDGRWTDATSGATFETENPFTGRAWATIPRGTPEDADRAVKAAHRAFTSGEWKTMTASRRGALRNGVTREEIREVLLQVAIYCGVPAGVDAFRNAREVFAEIDGAKAKS